MSLFPPALFGQIEDPLRLLEGLFAHSPVGVQLFDAKGHSLFVNDAFLEIFGAAPPAEYCVLHDEFAARYGIDHLIRAAFEGQATKVPVSYYEAGAVDQVKRPYQRCRAVEIFMVPILDQAAKVKQVVFFFRDATLEASLENEKQTVQKKLDDAHCIIDGLINGTQAVIYAKDLEGRYLFVNRQYGRVVGLPLDEIIGRLQSEIHPEELAKKMREADLRAIHGQIEVEESVLHPDGSRHDYLSLKFPLADSEGKVYGVCGISTDITNVRRLERELGQAQRMQSLGLLAGGVAHDFNNLLGMILLHTESLSHANGAAMERDLGQIRGAVERASGLVRQLLAFGGGVPLEPRVLELNAIIQDHRSMISSLVGEAVVVDIRVAESECNITADPTKVEQVLLNLCVNSRDALNGSGRIQITTGIEEIRKDTKELRLACPPGRYAWFEVADDGPGMTASILERAFDPFFTTKSRKAGSGLGLASVFGIVRESGGGIRVSTSPGLGCAVRVFLPVTDAKVEVVNPVTKNSTPSFFRHTVVLVEDEPLLREIIARLLREKGFQVLEAQDASEVPKLFRENSGITLLISDVIMPGESGPSLVKALEGQGLLRGVGVVFISGYSSDELERYGFKGRDMHLLEKPFTTDDLLEKIRDAHSSARLKPDWHPASDTSPELHP